jgi:6-phosphofructokinase
MRKRRIAILTGGGDVQPLNALIASANETARQEKIELLGFLHGWQGVLEKSFIKLSNKNIPKEIGGTILRSSRLNVATVDQGTSLIRNNLAELDIEGLIVVGGEDTLSNSFLLQDFPQVLISKTIDNDVWKLLRHKSTFSMADMINYFTLGHPSAAQKISSFVSLQEGVRTTAYSHERIIVVESMGMHAGWLALSSCMGNPDFIIVPEFPLKYEVLLQKVADRYKRNRHVIIVVAEGARWEDGSYMSADAAEKDDFGHPRFKGAAAILSSKIKLDLKDRFDTRNVNSVNPSYIYRSGHPCNLDLQCGSLLGKKAVQYLKAGFKESVFIVLNYKNGKNSTQNIALNSISNIEQFHRFLDDRMYNPDELCATHATRRYLKTIIPEFSNISYGL